MHSRLASKRSICLILCGLLVACYPYTKSPDPTVEAARDACGELSGTEQYDCYERDAVEQLNPEICRLVGISIDDMCLQAVYEAAENPAVCERIYLQGFLPNCRAYYAHYTLPPTSPTRTSEIPAVTMTLPPTSTVLPIAKPTNLPTPAPSPTPQYVLDLSGYDPDIFPPIDVSHNPPSIARSDEMVVLVFDFANIFCMNFPVSCIPEGVLHYSYGETNGETIPLEYEIFDEMDSLVARLPATEQEGRALRYYAKFSVPEAGYTQRYPGAGTIDLITTEKFITVELPVMGELRS